MYSLILTVALTGSPDVPAGFFAPSAECVGTRSVARGGCQGVALARVKELRVREVTRLRRVSTAPRTGCGGGFANPVINPPKVAPVPMPPAPPAAPAAPKKVTTTTTTTVKTETTVDALDAVNAIRVRSGLRPFVRDAGLSAAAASAATFRAVRGMFGHTSNDFQFLPPGCTASAAGCAGNEPRFGFMACGTDGNYTHAGAAWVLGGDGRLYCHAFYR